MFLADTGCFFIFGGSDRPALAACLEVDHVGIDTVSGVQLVGAALLRHNAVGQHDYLIRAGHGAHAVGDDQDRFVLDEARERSG